MVVFFFWKKRRSDPWYVVQNGSNGCVFTHLKPYYHISQIDEITIFHILAIFGFWPIFSLFFNIAKNGQKHYLFHLFMNVKVFFFLNVKRIGGVNKEIVSSFLEFDLTYVQHVLNMCWPMLPCRVAPKLLVLNILSDTYR